MITARSRQPHTRGGGRLARRLLVLVLAAACLHAGRSHPDNDTGGGETWEAVQLGEGHKLEDMLHWAIVNSDAQALEEQAQDAQRPEHGGDFLERQQRVMQLLRAMKEQPTERELILDAIAIIGNATEPEVARRNALEALQLLVEPIDHANDLHKLGGLAPVVALLGAASPQLRQGAALVLGTAASNNEAFQEQLLRHHPEAVPALMRLVNSASGGFTPLPPPAPAAASRWGSWWPWGSKPAAAPPAAPAPAAGGSEAGGADDATLAAGSDAAAAAEDCSLEGGRREDEAAAAAGLYALAAVIRTNKAARAMFYAAGGMQSLESVLLGAGLSLRIRRRALNLLTDVIQLDAGAVPAAHAALNHTAAAGAMLALLRRPSGGSGEEDLDMQEKALLALLALLEHHGGAIDGGVLAGAGPVLQRLQQQLAASLAAAGAGGSGGGTEGAADPEEVEFEQEVLHLAGRVQRQVEAQLAQRKRAEL